MTAKFLATTALYVVCALVALSFAVDCWFVATEREGWGHLDVGFASASFATTAASPLGRAVAWLALVAYYGGSLLALLGTLCVSRAATRGEWSMHKVQAALRLFQVTLIACLGLRVFGAAILLAYVAAYMPQITVNGDPQALILFGLVLAMAALATSLLNRLKQAQAEIEAFV